MVKIYCKKINHDEKDRKLDIKDHPELDDLPRKSVGQQVEAFILAGQSLDMSRRAMFELDNYDENLDVEEYDTGLDEYSDFHDYQEAQKDMVAKFKQVDEYRKEQAVKKKQHKKEEQSVEKDLKVEKDVKDE